MNTPKKLTSIAVISLALGLTACGGDTQTSSINSDNTPHPAFSWAKVAVSNNYSPSGDITDLTPTFSWKAVSGATVYNFGHESTNGDGDWKEYTVPAAEAGCATSSVCSYKPANHIFNIGDQKAWWVRGEVTNQWQDWSSAHVFKVINTGTTPTSAAPISPKGETLQNAEPTFKWTSINNAKNYVIGFEKSDGSGWQSITIQGNNKQSYTLSSSLSEGDYTWWVRAELSNGNWSNWSNGADFTVDTTKQVKPFSNTPDIREVVKADNSWYGISGNSLLKSDGVNVSTVFTSAFGITTPLYTNISGKINFLSLKVKSTRSTPRKKEQLIFLDTKTNESKVTHHNPSITKRMKDYLIVNSKVSRRGGAAYYKIDKNGDSFKLGSTYRGSRTNFTILETNSQTNTIHLVNSRPIPKSNKYKKSYHRVTDAVGIGLEDMLIFKDIPDIHSIVVTNNIWYGISGNSVFKSEDSNVSTVFTSPFGITTRLYTNISGKIYFLNLKEKSTQYTPHEIEQLIFIDTKTNEKKVIAPNKGKTSIIKDVSNLKKGYLILNIKSSTNGSSSFYKIDKNGDTYFLAAIVKGTSDFEMPYSHKQTNVTHVVITKYKNGNPEKSYKKVTDSVGIGLENDLVRTPPSGFHIDLQLYANALDLRWNGIGQSTSIQVSYDIYRNDKFLGKVNAALGDSPNYYDTSIERGETYHYKIRRVDSAGNTSAYSKTITVIIPEMTPPSGLHIDLQLYANALDLRWSGIRSSKAQVRYDIYRNDKFLGKKNAALGDSPSYYDRTIQRGETYHYKIKRIDSAGNTSAYSKTISVTIPK